MANAIPTVNNGSEHEMTLYAVSHTPALHEGNRGFTLIELMITVAIIAILATIALPLGEITVQRSKEQEFRRSLQEIRDAIDAYKQAVSEGRITKAEGETGYPKTLESLAEGVVDVKDPKGAKIYFLRRIPREPFATDPSTPAAATWGKRSYASGPDDPREGEDIYDVYTLTTGKGLNGIPYREW